MQLEMLADGCRQLPAHMDAHNSYTNPHSLYAVCWLAVGVHAVNIYMLLWLVRRLLG
jgi:hypothetical protein